MLDVMRIQNMPRKPLVPRTRCSGTMTEAGVVSWVLSALRRLTMKWKPKFERLNAGRIKLPYGKNGREVWCNSCEECKIFFRTCDLEMDHIENLGGLQKLEDAGQWLIKALVESDGYQRLCHSCHQIKIKEERKK